MDEEKDKKEGLLKRLKNIEDKNKQLPKTKTKIRPKTNEITDFIEESLSQEAKALIEEIRTIQKNVDYRKLTIRGDNNITYDFSDFKTFNELFRDIHF